MITALDTNVIVALWDRDERLSSAIQSALDDALTQGNLTISAPVFSELMAGHNRDEKFLNTFFAETRILIDWRMEEEIWRIAGRAFRDYAARRRKQKDSRPRRILADFLIGAHAVHRGYRLMTLDDGVYRSSFATLQLMAV